MIYKMIVLDLDGTLTNSDKVITPRTRDALMKVQKEGVRVVLASGRPPYGMWPIAEELQLMEHGGYMICFNGGSVIDCATGDVVSRTMLSPTLLPEVYEFTRGEEAEILVYRDDHVVCENLDSPYVKRAMSINKMGGKRVDDFVSTVTYDVEKWLIVGEPSTVRRLETTMGKALGEKVGVFRSSDSFLEIVPLGIEKSHALRMVAERFGIEREQIIAFGDAANDITMIDFAGMGVAMGNAEQAVKDRADFITLSNDEDGVEYALRKLMGLELMDEGVKN